MSHAHANLCTDFFFAVVKWEESTLFNEALKTFIYGYMKEIVI